MIAIEREPIYWYPAGTAQRIGWRWRLRILGHATRWRTWLRDGARREVR